jgi:iron complex outermembrane recepter protein
MLSLSRRAGGIPGPLLALTLIFVCVEWLSPCFGAAADTQRAFAVEAGAAETTLEAFAEQADISIVYPLDDVRGVATHPVHGRFGVRAALDRLIAGTVLEVQQDGKSGAFVVRRKRASSTPPDTLRAPETPTAGNSQNMPKTTKTKRPLTLLAAWLGLSLASGEAVQAQDTTAQRTGTVTGVVSNQATGDFLAGAQITVEGTSVATATERDGTFRLTLPEGQYNLVVSFTGLDPQRVDAAVGADRNIHKDVQLTSGIYRLDPVSVSGVREGSALALQTQRQAVNAKTVVATDTFGNPAANPGELLQRLPGISTEVIGSEVREIFIRGLGPGFSSLLIDGEQTATSMGSQSARNYQIEQYGTGNIESVELIKAPLPDQDANAVAGYANLVSRRGFDVPRRRIAASIGTMWRQRGFSGSPFRDRPDDIDILNISFADAFGIFGRERNLGIAFNANRRVSWTTQDEQGPLGGNVANIYLNPNSDNPLQRQVAFGEFGHPSVAQNAGLNVDYKVSPDAVLFLRLSFNRNDQYQMYHRISMGNTAANAANFAPGSTFMQSRLLPHPGSVSSVESAIFTKKSKNYQLSGGTEWKLFDRSTTLTLRGNYAHADIDYPGWIRTEARIMGGVGFEIDRRGQDPWFPKFTQTDGPSVYDPASYRMNSMIIQKWNAPNDLYIGRLDVDKVFQTVVPTSVKLGGKHTSSRRKFNPDQENYTWVGADGVFNSADDSLAPYTAVHYRQGDGRYGPFPFPGIPGRGRDAFSVPSGYWRMTANNVYTSFANSNAGDVRLQEDISAAYLQGRMRLGQLRVLGGVRVEETDVKGTAWVRNTSAAWGGNNVGGASFDPSIIAANLARAERSFVRRQTNRGNYRNVFPGVHFVYEPRNGLLFRASYNRSISRPAVANLVGTVTENPDMMTVSMGNPELKPWTSENFDVSVERYFEPVGLFSVGAFLKEISNYTRSFTTTVPESGIDGAGLYAGYSLIQQRNVGQARIRGIEASHQQQFSFLPGFWKGFGSYANFTYLEAEGNFGGVTTTRRLSNKAPRSGNAGITFRGYGWDIRLLGNWRDETYRTIQSGVLVYNAERLFVDAKIRYSITRRYDILLEGYNLTDEPNLKFVTKNGLKPYKSHQGIAFIAALQGRF